MKAAMTSSPGQLMALDQRDDTTPRDVAPRELKTSTIKNHRSAVHRHHLRANLRRCAAWCRGERNDPGDEGRGSYPETDPRSRANGFPGRNPVDGGLGRLLSIRLRVGATVFAIQLGAVHLEVASVVG